MWVAFEIDWAVVIPSIRSAPQKIRKRVRHKIFSSRSPHKRALLSTSDMLRLDAFYAIPRQQQITLTLAIAREKIKCTVVARSKMEYGLVVV